MTCNAECAVLVLGIVIGSIYIAFVVNRTFNAQK